jgi:hypothetical protein
VPVLEAAGGWVPAGARVGRGAEVGVGGGRGSYGQRGEEEVEWSGVEEVVWLRRAGDGRARLLGVWLACLVSCLDGSNTDAAAIIGGAPCRYVESPRWLLGETLRAQDEKR